MITHLRVVAIFHLIVEHVEVRFGHRFFLSLGYLGDVRIVRLLHVPHGEEIAGLDQRCHELCVAERLDAGVLRVNRMLHGAFPVRVFVHHLINHDCWAVVVTARYTRLIVSVKFIRPTNTLQLRDKCAETRQTKHRRSDNESSNYARESTTVDRSLYYPITRSP